MSLVVRKSIRLKLFLTFLLTTLLVVAGMYLFMRWSFNRGFNELVESRQHERVERLIENLEDIYSESGNWASLDGHKRRWIQLLLTSDDHRHRHPRPWMNQAMSEPADQWPPDVEPEHKRRFIPLELRAMLLRADKSIVFGRQDLLADLKLYPIEVHDQIVGYLGLLPGRPDNQLSDLRFFERQIESFAWIALLMIGLSAGLALMLAYMLGKPIRRIAAAAKELAVGRYTIRLPVESGDELGQLARDFNEMAAALDQAEQSRRQWVSDVSHELRTPLAILRGELEALQDGIRPMNPEAVDSLLADVLRLNRLTDDLYQLALSDQGALSYRKSRLDPIALLRADLAALAPAFEQKQVKVDWLDRTSGNISLYADPDRLSQLFRNILSNSANYTDSPGKLKVNIAKQADRLVVEFADSSPGVALQDLHQLFERFYRVESSRSRNHGGAGLGLAICQNIVAAHDGTIMAQPSELGGLAIRIELPLLAS
ncbi:MAG: ATP-binding protein [Gammaproteobacteria bacterium]